MKDFYEYWNRVKKYPKLKYQQLATLLSSKSVRNIEMVVQYFQRRICFLVKNWLENAKRYGVSPMDLVQAGNVGLQKAIDTFNCGQGQDFYPTAEGYIKSYIECEFYKHTAYSRDKGKELVAQHEKERKRNMLFCKETEPLNLYPVTYLSQVIGEDTEGNPLKLEDTLHDNEMDRWLEKLEMDDVLKILRKANGKIHPKAQETIELRYGVGRRRYCEPLSLSETGKIIHYSKVGVLNIENKVLEFLRKQI